MNKVLVIFAVGIVVPAAIVLLTLVVLLKTDPGPVPIWVNFGSQALGFAFIYWRLRPGVTKAVLYALVYLVIFNFILLNGGLSIMTYLGGGGIR
jgi:hypothetical protein